MNITNPFSVCVNKVGTTVIMIFLVVTSYGQINGAYMGDISVSSRIEPFEPKTTLKKVVNILELQAAAAQVNLYSCVIGEGSIARINQATLPEDNGSSVVVRKRQISDFIKKGLADFEYLAQPATHQRTEIMRSLVSMSEYLSIDAQRNMLIIESDMVESGFVYDFNDHSNNPKSLIENFDEVLAVFQADGELPDLSGVEVIIVATRVNNELCLWSTRWWKKAMLDHFGAKSVQIKAAL